MSIALSCTECKSFNIILQGDYKPGRIRGFWSWNVSPWCNKRKCSPSPNVFCVHIFISPQFCLLHAHIMINELCHDKSVPFFLLLYTILFLVSSGRLYSTPPVFSAVTYPWPGLKHPRERQKQLNFHSVFHTTSSHRPKAVFGSLHT